MKSKIIKLLALLAISILAFSCIKCIPGSGSIIYKTRGDYFDLARITMYGDEYIYPYTSNLLKIEGKDTIYVYWCITRLQDNYVFDSCRGSKIGSDIFLSLTWRELYQLEEELNISPLPMEILEKYILDTDPYIEFYQENDCPPFFSPNDSLRLNEIIQNGELNKYFKRLK